MAAVIRAAVDRVLSESPADAWDRALSTAGAGRSGLSDVSVEHDRYLDAVGAGERVVLTVHGEAVADIVPHGRRTRWLPGDHFRRELVTRAADPALSCDLDALAGQTLDEV